MDDKENIDSRNYQQLINASPAPINLFDESGEIIWGNDAVVDLLGLESREQLIGRSIFEFIVSDDHYTAKQELIDVVENENPSGPTPMRLQRDDGEMRSIQVATAPGRYQGQNIGQAVVVDVTELQNTYGELEKERQFIDDALNTLPDVFYYLTPDGELDRWNDSLLEVSGYDDKEVRTMDVEDFFIESHIDRIRESIETAFDEGGDSVEATVITKQGTEIPFEFRKRRLLDDGTVVGVVGIGRDISEQKAREQHLRAVDYLLKHNLRNQLNIIQGTVDVVQDSISKQDPSAVDRIDTAIDRLLSLFDNHHLIVEQLTTPQSVESIDVVVVLESLVQEHSDAYPEATVTADLPRSATVSAMPTLELALREVIENAIVHNDRTEPRVDIVVEATESKVTIQIDDDGPLIPEMEYHSFSDDYHVDSTHHSTGFGLWFTHLVVMQSGGSLNFDRDGTRGNVITIELPTQPTTWLN